MPTNKPEFYSKTPEELQKLLDSGVAKTSIARQLNVSLKTLNKYIKKYDLKYIRPIITPKKPKVSGRGRRTGTKFREPSIDFIPNDLKTPSNAEALENFYKIIAAKKEKRLIQELKDAYY